MTPAPGEVRAPRVPLGFREFRLGFRGSPLLGGSWVVISRVMGFLLRLPLKGSIGILGLRV